MSASLVSRVIYGFRIEKKIDRWDEKYLPHIEGHPDTNIMMYNSESEKDVWYCGILLASSNDGIYKEVITCTKYDVELYEFCKNFSLNTDVPVMYILNMME